MSYEDINAFKGIDEKEDHTGFDLAKSKEFYAELCKGLSVPTARFKPDETIQKLKDFINRPGINRMLYSEISSYMYNLESYNLNSVLLNTEKLLKAVLEGKDNGIPLDCKKIVIKIYDHCNLISSQTNNAQQIQKKGHERLRRHLEREVKGNSKALEREYITILGIFASIVLAFVGGSTFSSSVLQNIGNVSSYRLFGVIIAIGIVLINILFMLMKFICAINEIPFSRVWIYWANVIAAGMFLLVVIARWFQL